MISEEFASKMLIQNTTGKEVARSIRSSTTSLSGPSVVVTKVHTSSYKQPENTTPTRTTFSINSSIVKGNNNKASISNEVGTLM